MLFPFFFFINTGVTGYYFINEKVIPRIYELFQISPRKFLRSIPVKGYDGHINPKVITYSIYLTITV